MANLPGQKKKILLIFHNPQQSELLKQNLEACGFEVHPCKSLQTASMMLAAGRRISLTYSWLIINSNAQDLSEPFLETFLQAQQTDRFRVIFFHHQLEIESFSNLGMANAYAVPISATANSAALGSTLYQVIAKAERAAAGQLRPQPRVLLVEDNDIGRLMARTLLEKLGCTVVEATNGAEAVTRAEQENFDLLLTDILMPVMDGIEAISRIRKLKPAALPIVAMSANADSSWSNSFHAGADGYLVKPFEMKTLRRELDKWINLPEAVTTDPAPPPSPLLELLTDHLDVTTGLNRAGGKLLTYLRMLHSYRKHFDNFESTLRQELQTDELTNARRRIHNLKGVAGTLGASRLYDLSRQVEKQLRASEIPAGLEALFQEHRELCTRLDQLPPLAATPAVSSLPAGTSAELHALLTQLKTLALNHQARQVKECLGQLQQRNWPPCYTKPLQELQRQLETFQYSAATDMINTLFHSWPDDKHEEQHKPQ